MDFHEESARWRELAELELLYRQGPCFVIAKPAGLLTQAPPHLDSVERRVKDVIRRLEEKVGRVYLGVPHRIDRPASGALVLARHVRAAKRLSEQFQRRTIRKTYWAVVSGLVSPAQGQWRDHLRKVPGEARAEVAAEDHPDAREAILNYRVLRQDATRTWLEVDLVTGRTHQIRVQAASRGWPILGDLQYGSAEPFGPDLDDQRLKWIALHARRLAFQHPMTREPVDIEAPATHWPALFSGGR